MKEKKKKLDLPPMFGGYGSLDEMNMAYMLKFAARDQAKNRQNYINSRLEREGKPILPDKNLEAESGWVTPDGKFYACLTPMEHVWLALQFGNTERQAERSGWIKIVKDITAQIHIFPGEIEATQKQIDTISDWCEKHNHPLPYFAGGEE